MRFRDVVYEAIHSRMETMRLAGHAPDDHAPVSIMTDYVRGCLGNAAVREQYEEDKKKHATARTAP